ncbi:amino acid synthesis family protein [Roseococcus thiosulfatophilus]|uniref:amino acid synthesis family protein n=1 Tax=Roseococcus thiosulfatophilus TaxID=35813 RepID=UPI001A8CBA0D|nr:amino acid synthesis family protein [Roseococcus thiosulfatophilus]
MIIRKYLSLVEEVALEQGQTVTPPIRRAVAACVLQNPFAGRYVEDLAPLIEAGEALGAELAARAVAALGIPGEAGHSFGKAAVVGEGGELEHAAALLHPKMGAPVRAALGKGPALIPSAKKRGGMGTAIDIPLGHKDAAFVRSHFDAIEFRCTDAPMAGEILLCLALTTGGRPLPRIGGLEVKDIMGTDGLR